MDNDIERQKKLEADAVRDGLLRYAKSYEYHLATDSKPVRDVLGHCLKPLADVIRAEQLKLKTSQGQKLEKYVIPLASVHAEPAALITLGIMFNAISRSEFNEGTAPGVTSVVFEVGERCRIERRNDCEQKREIDLVQELLVRNRSRNAGRRAEEAAQNYDDPEYWKANRLSFHLGRKLIDVAVLAVQLEGAPVFELKTSREGGPQSTKTTVSLTDTACDWIAEHQPALESLMSPVYRPMIVPPQPMSLAGGGYLVRRLPLLKREPSKRTQRLLKKTDLTPVLSAVNAMQDTAFRINDAILRDLREGWDAKGPFFKLEKHQNNKGAKQVIVSGLALAEQFREHPRIYYPHQVDHRGRAYPVPQLVNPQSDAIGRSPLEFADGKPLGERGPHWLAVHLANCFGKNKVSFDERVSWVRQNEQDILAFAAHPLHGHRFWKEAKKPWLVRAACKEWKGYREQGPGFRSHLVVSMDGSCNGYQHLSAMGRDPFGGRATNLMPGIKPEDIYQDVADRCSWRLARDAGDPRCREARARQGEASREDQFWARQLLGKIDRDLVKPATMTTPYGVSRGTIYEQLLETDAIKSCINPPECARYLAKVLEESIPEVAIEAGKIMVWLRNVAGILAKANRPVAWTTPTGFYVVHGVREPKAVRVTTADSTFTIYADDEKRKIDWRKQVDGIVAHFVHSMDAAHMMLTINRLYAEGLRHFAMVHDSFGVHACDIDLLHRVLREEFVRIYSEPVLRKFLEEQRQASPDLDLPEPPQAGDLDIRQVIESPYFFA